MCENRENPLIPLDPWVRVCIYIFVCHFSLFSFSLFLKFTLNGYDQSNRKRHQAYRQEHKNRFKVIRSTKIPLRITGNRSTSTNHNTRPWTTNPERALPSKTLILRSSWKIRLENYVLNITNQRKKIKEIGKE